MTIRSQKILPKFSRDGKVTTDQQISAFFIVSGALAIQYEDFSIRLFVENLIESIAEWFGKLPTGSVTSRATLIQSFKRIFKIVKDEHLFLSQ